DVIEIAASELSDPGAMTRHFKKLARYLGADDVRQRLQQDGSWHAAGARPAVEGDAPFERISNPDASERFRSCVPLLSLEAAAGAFGSSQSVAFEEWVRPRTSRTLGAGMFVARVVGKSMEPRIPDGSYVLFKAPVTGSRGGRIVLVQLHDHADPETGGRYTVKRYESERVADEDGAWRHVRITLQPENPEFGAVVLTGDSDDHAAVIAELIEVLGTM
ncbi:MAG: helix-turn-helix transcriptional regulator, partial [Phycisphaerales bacterium]|nr:helix-turn-helix transcriptional regulator [Phycisphaerales bacterium]